MGKTQTPRDFHEEILPEKNWQQEEDEYWQKKINDFLGETEYFGKVADFMIRSVLLEAFSMIGLHFSESGRNGKIEDRKNQIYLNIDYDFKNNDTTMLVSHLFKGTMQYINRHIEDLKTLRSFFNLHGNTHKILGAVASAKMTKRAKEYALEQGLYVVEPSGETFKITSPDGKAKEW